MVPKLRLILLTGLMLWGSGVLFATLKAQEMVSLDQSALTKSLKPEKKRPLIDVLKELGEKAKVFFSYETELLKGIYAAKKENYTTDVENELKQLLAKTNLNFKKIGDKYFLIFQKKAPSKKSIRKMKKEGKQMEKNGKSGGLLTTKISRTHKLPSRSLLTVKRIEITVTGTVTDEEGNPLPGATVAEKGTTNGTTSDVDGRYSLEVGDNATIIVSFVGFIQQEIVVNNRTLIDIQLSENVAALDEVVVVGYGRQQRRDITGSVASLSSKQIKDIPLTNFENAIHGQLPGVQVLETSGEPGAGPDIRVRGLGSITAGNEPLYVVDGYPVSKNVAVGVQGDVFRRRVAFRPPTANPLGTLNPNDIESIQVLKDASAASIYGSRGSNGVIIITTKKGKRSGKPVVSYDAFVGVQRVANRVDLMNAAELAAYTKDARNNAYLQDVPGADINDSNAERNDKATAAGLSPSGNWRIPQDFQFPDGTDTDWLDLVLTDAMVTSHNLSVSGGSENIGYYIAGGYFNQEGIVEGSNFERYSLRMNLEADIFRNVRVGMNLNPSFTTSDRLPVGSPYFARPPGIIYSAMVHSPTINPFNDDGTPNQRNNQSHITTEDGQGAGTTTASNPLAIIEGIDDQLNQFRTFANVYVEFDITDDLTFKTYAGVDINNYKRNFFRKNSLLYRNATVGDPYGQSSSSEAINWIAEQTLSYNKAFSGGHSLAAVVGYTAQREKLDVNQIVADNFPDDQVPTVNGGQISQGRAFQEEWSLVSILGRVNYDYKDKYLLTATFRADRSSRFGAGNKTGVFPSVSVGWRLSNEEFFSGLSWLSDLKLRASWGQTGNFLIPNYAAIGLLSSQESYVLGDAIVNGVAPSTISNENLSWEKSDQIDIGLDFGLLEDRIYGSIEYYNRTTSDLILEVQVPAALGFTNAFQNIGEVVNKGWELSLTSRNTTGAFKWTTNINFATLDNEVTKLGPEGDPILSRGGAGLRHITRIGDPIGSYYGHVVAGIYQNQAQVDAAIPDALAPDPRPGDFFFEDINGDGVIDQGDRTVTGNYLPDYTFGITNTFSYKGFELSFIIQGVQGNEVLNLTRRHLANGEANFNSYAVLNDRWISESQPGNGEIPRADRRQNAHGNNNRPSSYQVEDASYIRLRNVSLGYTFPKSVFGDRIDRLRIYLTGTNLFTITDYVGFNPEVNNQAEFVNVQGEDYGAYPLSSIFTFGVNASF